MSTSGVKVNGFIKVKENTYISKNDPNFFQKLMQENSDIEKAFTENYTQPLEVAHIIADKPAEVLAIHTSKNKKPLLFAGILTALTTAILGITLSTGFTGATAVNAVAAEKPAIMSDEQELKVSLVRTAIDNFYVAEGEYPSSLAELTSKIPNNWLSMIPSGIEYGLDDQRGYYVVPSGFDPKCTCKSDNLSLSFFGDTNQLALMQGDKAISIYNVASGRQGSELPFGKSRVTNRVVDPNGGKGVFGTRSIALEGNYAIHGTNQEDLVGDRVSHGCLRMKATDIEELYPYVSIGTPFKVESGEPKPPKYTKGLPSLGGRVDHLKESTKQTFHWNG
jgi:hypothetical protein